jgi:hypothetical protein
MPTPKKKQTRTDREYIVANLPEGTQRVQVISAQGKQQYKRPEDVDLVEDEIVLTNDGSPVVMRGKPGRRPKAQLNAVTPQIAEVTRAKDLHIEEASLVREMHRDADGDAALNAILEGMALEASSMEFERKEAERHGQDTVNISAKRSRVLKAMADTLLKKKAVMSAGVIDMESPAFHALFTHLLESFKDSMVDAGARGELVETVFANLGKTLDNESWREDARLKMREKLL